MLKKYRNELFNQVKLAGISPEAFTIIDKEDLFGVSLRNSKLSFFAYTYTNTHHSFDYKCVQFSPDFSLSDRHIGLTFVDIRNAFLFWLNEHVSPYIGEQTSPDLWASLQQGITATPPDIDRDTEPFTDSEKQQIRLSILDFRATVVRKFEPNTAELAAIAARLDYLAESLDRLNRIDWQGLSFSTVITISVALSLDTEQGQQLFDLFKNVFRSTVHLLTNTG